MRLREEKRSIEAKDRGKSWVKSQPIAEQEQPASQALSRIEPSVGLEKPLFRQRKIDLCKMNGGAWLFLKRLLPQIFLRLLHVPSPRHSQDHQSLPPTPATNVLLETSPLIVAATKKFLLAYASEGVVFPSLTGVATIDKSSRPATHHSR